MYYPVQLPLVSSRLRLLSLLAAALLLTAIVFRPSFGNEFLAWDDAANVTGNLAIRSLNGANLHTYFTTPLMGMYTPLVYLSYAVDYRLGALNPFVYHLTNLALHSANVALVLMIVLALSKRLGVAMAVALLFAVHPVNVAAIVPISVRSSLLYSLFDLAAYLAYLSYLDTGRAGRIVLSFVLFVCASLSKSAAVVLPVLLVLTDLYRGRPRTRAMVIEKAPFFAVALIFGALTFVFRADVGAPHAGYSSADGIVLGSFSLMSYLARLIVPAGLSPYEPYPSLTMGALPAAVRFAPYAMLLLVAALVRLAFYGREDSRGRAILFGACWFVLHVGLVLKLVPIGVEFTADRYVYLSSIGFFFAIAECWPKSRPLLRRVGVAALAIVVLASSVSASARTRVWQNDLTFNDRVLARHPDTAVAYANRCAARLRARQDPAAAVNDCDQAIRLDPSEAGPFFNRATGLLLLGRRQDARMDVTRAIDRDTSRPEYYQLRAEVALAMGDSAQAAADATRAIELGPSGPDSFKAYVSRGVARMLRNEGTGALEDFDRAIALNPGAAATWQNRGQSRVVLGDPGGGCADLQHAADLGLESATRLMKDLCKSSPHSGS